MSPKFHSATFVSMTFLATMMPGLAHAYLDPGTGSMLLQIILGGLAGLAVAGKLFWHRVLRFFGITRKKQVDRQEPAQSEPEEA